MAFEIDESGNLTETNIDEVDTAFFANELLNAIDGSRLIDIVR